MDDFQENTDYSSMFIKFYRDNNLLPAITREAYLDNFKRESELIEDHQAEKSPPLEKGSLR